MAWVIVGTSMTGRRQQQRARAGVSAFKTAGSKAATIPTYVGITYSPMLELHYKPLSNHHKGICLKGIYIHTFIVYIRSSFQKA